MINIKIWKDLDTAKNIELKNMLKKEFNLKTDVELNLVKNRTFQITLIKDNLLLGGISLIQNDDLKKYLDKRKIPSSNDIYSFKADKGIYVYNLVVNPKYRKLGIGKKLLDIAIYVSRSLGIIYCHTHCENEISEHIFTKKGFVLENSFKNAKNQTIKLMNYWLN